MLLGMQLKWDAQALVLGGVRMRVRAVSTLVRMDVKMDVQVASTLAMAVAKMQTGKVCF